MSEYDDDVLKKLTEAVSHTTSVMTRMLAANEEQAKIASLHAQLANNFREEIREIKRSLEKIVHVLHEGNGERPLITRVALIESRLDEREKTDDANTTGKWGLRTAVVGAVAALAGSIITTILQGIL